MEGEIYTTDLAFYIVTFVVVLAIIGAVGWAIVHFIRKHW
ncbi:hypothetical protein ES708_08937 [subsurface metagenome]